MYGQYYCFILKFEWDEQKNESNIKKQDYCEERTITVGLIGNSVCVVVYTRREEICRIISARKANEREKRRYYERIEKSET